MHFSQNVQLFLYRGGFLLFVTAVCVSLFLYLYVCAKCLCVFPISPLPLLALCFLLVVTTPTIAHSTLSAVRLPDSPPEPCVLSPRPKIVTLSPLCTAEQLSVWI